MNSTRAYWLGLALTVGIAAFGVVIARWTGYSAVLVTLAFGMIFNPLVERPGMAAKVESGLQVSLGLPFQIGTSLLGLRITSDMLGLMSPAVIILILSSIGLTVAVSVIVNRCVRWSNLEAVLTGCAVAICGASALMALSSVLRPGRITQEKLIALIVTVIGFSAVAMITYPFVVRWIGFDDATGALIMGATIHQISQVVGAGAFFGEDGMAIATMSKMLRVVCLVPVTIIFVCMYAKFEEGAERRRIHPMKSIPLFVYGFLLCLSINLSGLVPESITSTLLSLSNVLILLAVAAISVKTNLRALFGVGWKAIVLVAIDSLFLLGWVVVGLVVLLD
ncbi:MAG: putative sulfate exporter family transporter [Duodenibacillus sp.]|nr:putative sulfate exporter family transporter [Duodenibacillus sp.]